MIIIATNIKQGNFPAFFLCYVLRQKWLSRFDGRRFDGRCFDRSLKKHVFVALYVNLWYYVYENRICFKNLYNQKGGIL